MRVNYLAILLTNNEKYVIVEFAISYRKGTETNSEKWCENKKEQKLCRILVGGPGSAELTRARWSPAHGVFALMGCNAKRVENYR